MVGVFAKARDHAVAQVFGSARRRDRALSSHLLRSVEYRFGTYPDISDSFRLEFSEDGLREGASGSSVTRCNIQNKNYLSSTST
jgi:hypothetical protein